MTEQKIRILHDHIVNQIAAGEVIENAASVAKELIENSLDAGATDIFIETKYGGRHLIKVSDNGCGMSADDLLLSVERHATSKLQDVDGLSRLSTLGFRGEALPSIASISKMKLHSASSQTAGYFIEIEGGKMGKLTPLARRPGTTIEARSLFFNVPVRKKFQKTLAHDVAELHRLIIKFALCYPLVGFKWMNDGQIMIELPMQDSLQRRIHELLGEQWSNNLTLIDNQSERLSIEGGICQPFFTRPNRTGQHLFINKRAVVCPFIAQKVLEAYGTRIESQRFPHFVLSLELPGSWIDVNVHPQKKEIRICEEKLLEEFIHSSIQRALGKTEHIPISSLPPVFAPPPLQMVKLAATENVVYYQDRQIDLPESVKYKILARMDHYLLIEAKEGILLVDSARALERILYEEKTDSRLLATQALLLPLQLSFKGKEKILLLEKLELLQKQGISIRHFGADDFIIDAIPSFLEQDDLQDLIVSYLEGNDVILKLTNRIKNKNSFLDQAEAIVEKLFCCENSELTPSGKKIHMRLDKTSLEKLFDAQDRKSKTAAQEI